MASAGDGIALRFFRDDSRSTDPNDCDRWTWADLRNRARGVAALLAETGRVTRGSRVLLAHPAGLEFVAALMGCFYLGAIPVPVPPPARREKLSRLQHIARDAGVAAIVTMDAFAERLAPLAEEMATGPCLTPAAADPSQIWQPRGADFVTPELRPDDIAFLQYTSGSTGTPKGVMISHGNMIANLRQIRQRFRTGADDSMFSWLPHYHDMGLIGSVLFPIYCGIPVALMSPAAFLRDPMRFLELAGHLKTTEIGGPNFAYDHCARLATPEALARIDLGALRMACSGAETIRAATLQRFNAVFAPAGLKPTVFLCCYGMAEATLCISAAWQGDGPALLHVDRAALANRRVVLRDGAEATTLAASGALVEGAEAVIVDPDTGLVQAVYGIGEIWIRGPNMAQGYWQQPEATAAAFGQSAGGKDDWFRTGDLGFLHDGMLFVTGRLKEIIIIRGQNHYPQDIEATVAEAHPGIAAGKVAAFAMDAAGEERVGLVCELRRSAFRDADNDAILAAIRAALAERHGLPAGVVGLLRPGALPITPSGKIQRVACRDGIRQGTLPLVAEWRAESVADVPRPQPALAAALHAAPAAIRRMRLLAQLLAALARAAGMAPDARPAEDQRFFDLGLDSLAGVRFIADLETALGLPLDPTVIYEHPTPAALTDHLLDRLFPAAPRPREAPATTVDDSDLAADIRALEALLGADP